MALSKKKKYILLKALKFGKEKLGITKPFTLKLSENRKGFQTTAYYNPETGEIAIYVKDRAIPDICRSSLHELQHHKDNELGNVKGNEPNAGIIDNKGNIKADDLENKANSVAGSLLKQFAKKIKEEEKIDIYNL